jgi:hypothetical protein
MTRRIRTLKPETTESESFARCSRDARLMGIYLITNADDEGRMRGEARMLARTLFPYDDDLQDRAEELLAELERVDFIRRYKVDGCHYLQIVNWRKHQKIDKPKPSKLPPPAVSPTHRGNVGDVSATHRRNVVDASSEYLDRDRDQDLREDDGETLTFT